jgi:ammonium transporter, Amt family
VNWTIFCGVIVFFMQTGFSFLESGSVRHKNYQNILLKNTIDFCACGIIWWGWGYGMAMSNVNGGFVGKENFFGYDMDRKWGNWFLSYVFASNATTIVSGALAERCKILNYLIFAIVMTGFIYPVIVAWVWGEGWLHQMGFLDFAGSGVVHLTGGVSGLVGTCVIGARHGLFDSDN